MLGIKLDEFSPMARRVILCVMCIPAALALWLAFVVLKPLYFSALDTDTKILPKSLTASPSLAPTVDFSDPSVDLKSKAGKGGKRKAAVADPGPDAGAGKVKKSAKGGKAPVKAAKGGIKLDSDPTKVGLGICGGAPPEFLPTIAFQTIEGGNKDPCLAKKKSAGGPKGAGLVTAPEEAIPAVVLAQDIPEGEEEEEEEAAEDMQMELAASAGNGTMIIGEDVIVDEDTGLSEILEEGEDEEDDRAKRVLLKGRRRLMHRTAGYTMSGTGCNKKHWTKVYHENDGAGPNVKKNVKPGEEQLVKCLQNIKHCNCETRKIAAQLDSIKGLDSKLKAIGKIGKGFKRYKTCAIVGNAGHLSEKKYGEYIDNHEFIVRFNDQPVQQYADHVGSRTSLRFANHRRSLALCCRGNFPEGKLKQNGTGVMIWYPGSQNEIMTNCKKRFPGNPIMNLDLRQGKVLAGAVKDLRKTLYRLGVGPFGEWRQLTSGGHAIMFMASICDSISVYGITTYNAANKGGADHYGAALSDEKTRQSATTRARSGQKWHDWKGEKYVWRLLNAAGKVNICSM